MEKSSLEIFAKVFERKQKVKYLYWIQFVELFIHKQPLGITDSCQRLWVFSKDRYFSGSVNPIRFNNEICERSFHIPDHIVNLRDIFLDKLLVEVQPRSSDTFNKYSELLIPTSID